MRIDPIQLALDKVRAGIVGSILPRISGVILRFRFVLAENTTASAGTNFAPHLLR